MALKIIVEGCDGTGKSTYIRKLKSLYPSAQVIHCTRTTPNTYQWFSRLLKDDNDYIFDRFHVGQFIYQNEDERRERGWMTIHQLHKLERLMNRRGAYIVYVTAPIDTILYNCQRDEFDSHYTWDYIKYLTDLYDDFMYRVSQVAVIPYYNDYHPGGAGHIDYDKIPTILAVDFDGTITTKNGFPDINTAEPDIEIINKCKTLKKCGVKIVLWTNRTDRYLDDAVKFCESYGLTFDAVNANVPEVRSLGLNPRKVWATEYWDDKAEHIGGKSI